MMTHVPNYKSTSFHPALPAPQLGQVKLGPVQFGLSQSTYSCSFEPTERQEKGYFSQLGERVKAFLGLPSAKAQANDAAYLPMTLPIYYDELAPERIGYSLNFWG